MKICVYGAGAVGGHLAARLSTTGADVSVIARGEQARAIRARGLTLLHGDERLVAPLRCVDDARELPPQDVVVVSVKGPALPSVAGALAPLLVPATRVIFAMNGIPWWFGNGGTIVLPDALVETLDPKAQLRRLLAPEQIVGSAVYSGNVVVEPGVIRNTTPQRNRLLLGRPDGNADETIARFAEIARRAGYQCDLVADIREAIWIKMQLIVSVSPVSALTGTTLAAIVNDGDLHAVAAALMREAGELGRHLGFVIADDAEERLNFYRAIHGKPSMLQDLEADKVLEIDNGIVAFRAIAAATGLAVPTLDAVGALLAGLARRRGLAPDVPRSATANVSHA